MSVLRERAMVVICNNGRICTYRKGQCIRNVSSARARVDIYDMGIPTADAVIFNCTIPAPLPPLLLLSLSPLLLLRPFILALMIIF